MKSSTSKSALARIVQLLVAAVSISAPCLAHERCGNCRRHHHRNGYFIDDSTRYFWSRTWHGPNALETPLSDYFIPRTPGACGYPGTETEVVEMSADGATNSEGSCFCPGGSEIGLEPVHFERIGQIPNDLDLGPDAAIAQPGR